MTPSGDRGVAQLARIDGPGPDVAQGRHRCRARGERARRRRHDARPDDAADDHAAALRVTSPCCVTARISACGVPLAGSPVAGRVLIRRPVNWSTILGTFLGLKERVNNPHFLCETNYQSKILGIFIMGDLRWQFMWPSPRSDSGYVQCL